jgi:hypothetical protein
MTDLDQVLERWNMIAELSELVRPTDTGHIRTAINVILDVVREREQRLCSEHRVALELMRPDRWQQDWLRNDHPF